MGTKRWKRVTVTLPGELAERIGAEGASMGAKLAPTVVRLAKEGLAEAEISRREREARQEARRKAAEGP